MNDRLTIQVGDCRELLKAVPDESVPCCVTSPPYDNLRTYGNYAWDFEGIALELKRVICDGGVVCWNVGDACENGSETLTSFKQAIFFVEKAGFKLHDTMIYEKSNGSKPNRWRYNQVFEYVFIFSNGKPSTFNPIKDKKNVTFGKSVFGRHTLRKPDGSMIVRKPRLIAAEYGMRGNVWKGNTRGQEEICKSLPHPAMMPKWLARDLIISWSNPGDLVLDPFSGSGTTGQMAVELGRRALLMELNPDYADMARRRTDVTPGFPM